jgi:collagenase-like PrtC family protease
MAAKTVKENFPDIDVRASVNMQIGTIKGLKYVSHLFDSFYLRRECNRDIKKIKKINKWADRNEKKIHILINSGCLNYCSGQIFHDNLVAHEAEIGEMDNIEGWNPVICWDFYKNRNNWASFLQNSWIRPEDLYYYDDLFPVVKLATRMHSNPRKVIESYTERKHYGNLMDLFEPGHSILFYPYIIDNSRFPDDWFSKIQDCDKNCHDCSYCSQVLKEVCMKIG